MQIVSPSRGLVVSSKSRRRSFRESSNLGRRTTHWRMKADGSPASIWHGLSTRKRGQLSTQMTKSLWRTAFKSWLTSWKRNSQRKLMRWRFVVRNTERHVNLRWRPRTQRNLTQAETLSFKCKFVHGACQRKTNNSTFCIKGHQFASADTGNYWGVINEPDGLEHQYSNGWASPREWRNEYELHVSQLPMTSIIAT